MNKSVIVAAVVGVVVIAVVAFYLFGGNVKKSISPKQKEAVVPTSTTGDRHSAVSEITVEGADFAFTPSTIVAKAGEKLTITFKNNGKMPHNLSIQDVGASKTIQPGQTETFTVTPEKAGMYQITCTVSSHAEKGMVGLLMVQ